MHIVFILACSTQIAPGPLDAYRANLASIHCSLDFVCNQFNNPSTDVIDDLARFKRGPGPASNPAFIVEGRWGYDGSVEHLIQRVTGGKSSDPKGRRGLVPPCELLYDGQLLAFHYLYPSESSLHIEPNVQELPFPALGPLTWFTTNRFDHKLSTRFANAKSVRKTAMRAGHHTEVEIYEMLVGDFRFRIEAAYDPEMGYRPRFCRSIAYGDDQGRSTASVSEFYLIDAKFCAAGGAVPTEWYLHGYGIDGFAPKYPIYDDETRLTPTDSSMLLHFKAVNVEDLKTPVRFERIQNITDMSAPGGPVELKRDRDNLTMAALRTQLGTKVKPTNRPIMPNIDQAELHKFDQPARRTPWLGYLVGAVCAVAAAGAFRSLRGSRLLVLLLSLGVSAGCGYKPVPRLAAAFSPTRVLYDPAQDPIKLDLTVNNVGNQTLRLFKVSAGCSCRHVDPSQLPATIRPGGSLTLPVGISGGRNFQPLDLFVTFETDQGELTEPVTLFTLPRHYLSPDSITLNNLSEVVESPSTTFDLVHREIHTDKEAGTNRPSRNPCSGTIRAASTPA